MILTNNLRPDNYNKDRTMTEKFKPEQNIATNYLDIPLSLIIADKRLNSRKVMDEDTIAELATTIKKEGQLTPVKVERTKDGKFSLVFGYRRFEAISLLNKENPEKWPTIRAEVVDPMDPLARKLANIAENMAREDLTTFDQAVAFTDLQKTNDLSGSRIASSVGKSVAYVNNLLRIHDGLDDSVLARWRAECMPNFGYDKEGKKLSNMHRVCTMDWLTKLVAKTPRDQQNYELQVALGLVDPDEGDDEEGGNGEPRQVGSAKRATMVNLKKALEAAEAKSKEAKADEKPELKGIVTALKFAIGSIKSIRGVYTSPAPGDKSDE